MSNHDGQEAEVTPDVERRIDAAEAEEAAYLTGLAKPIRDMLAAQANGLSAQVSWLRARTVDLNIALREKEEENAGLRAKLAAYECSEAIEAEAAKTEPEPEPPTA